MICTIMICVHVYAIGVAPCAAALEAAVLNNEKMDGGRFYASHGPYSLSHAPIAMSTNSPPFAPFSPDPTIQTRSWIIVTLVQASHTKKGCDNHALNPQGSYQVGTTRLQPWSVV